MDIHPNPRVQGLLNEDRFFQIIQESIERGLVPSWFSSLRRATTQEDLAGIDGFAYIYNKRGDLTQVPFQIKSHPDLIAQHYKEFKIFWMDRLPYFIVHPDIKARTVREKFFQELLNIRYRNEVFHRVEHHLAMNSANGVALIVEDPSQSHQEPINESGQLSLHLAAE